jgi:hypothetical protein
MDFLISLQSISGQHKSNPILIYCCIFLALFSVLVSALRLSHHIACRWVRCGFPRILPATFLTVIGLDLTVSLIRSLINFQLIEWTREILKDAGHTVELHLIGTRLLMTDDPENFKAIMSTQVMSLSAEISSLLINFAQFSDFEKGDIFYKTYHSILGDSIFASEYLLLV